MFDTNAKVSIIHLAVIASFFFFLCVEIEIINSSFSLRKIQSAQLVEYMHHKCFCFFFLQHDDAFGLGTVFGHQVQILEIEAFHWRGCLVYYLLWISL